MLKSLTQHPLYKDALHRWELPRDLLAGLPAMVGQVDSTIRHRKWVPPYPYEDTSSGGSYDRRVQRATLLSAFADAVDRIAAKSFSRGVQVQGLAPEVEALLDNIDGQGTSIHALGRGRVARNVGLGIGHLLVDWPDTTRLQDAEAQ